jgi:hypothetical protein
VAILQMLHRCKYFGQPKCITPDWKMTGERVDDALRGPQ